MVQAGEDVEPVSSVQPVGVQLATAREAQGLTISDVAAKTRIPARHLTAIEANEYSDLPAIPYSVGFVKSYAAMLNLDGAALSRQFRVEIGEPQQPFQPSAYEPGDPNRVPTRLLAIVALVVAMLVAIAYFSLRETQSAEETANLAAGPAPAAPAPALAAPIAPPMPLAPAPLAVAPIDTGVTITASEDVWLKVYERDGQRLYMDTLKAGESYSVPADTRDPLLWTGRPQVLMVSVGGRNLPSLGAPDRTIRDVSLKADALLGKMQPSTAVATPLNSLRPQSGEAAAGANKAVERLRP